MQSDGKNPIIIRQRNPVCTAFVGYEIGIHYQSLVHDSTIANYSKNIQTLIESTAIDNGLVTPMLSSTNRNAQIPVVAETTVSIPALYSGSASAGSFDSAPQQGSAASLVYSSMSTVLSQSSSVMSLESSAKKECKLITTQTCNCSGGGTS